jgi:hypothetical protein
VEPHAAQQLLARFDNLRFLDLSERVGVHAATSNVFGSILATLLEELRGTVTSRQRRKP